MKEQIQRHLEHTLEKHPGLIGQMFDRIAPTYDFLNHLLSAGIDVKWRKTTTRHLSLQPGDKVLDLACGTGDLGFAALKTEPKCQVVGVDIALNMLKIARKKHQKTGCENIRYQFTSGDILHLPFKSRTFHKTMVAFGIRNVLDTRCAFLEIHRVLKVGGMLGILEFSLPKHPLLRHLYLFYFKKVLPAIGGLVSRDPLAYQYLPSSVNSFKSPDELSRELQKTGFQIENIMPFSGGISYLLVARKLGSSLFGVGNYD